MHSSYLPRDFIETAEGLVFAVVDGQPEDGKVLSFLRYNAAGKVSTEAANALLRENHPHYLHHSRRLDAKLHAVPIVKVLRHHRPRARVRELLANGAQDDIEQKLLCLLDLLISGGVAVENLGVTGSLLIGRQTPHSDLDVVVYGRENFFRVRYWVGKLIEQGQLDSLDENAWREAYQRRGCELSYEEFLRHEQRKGNKGMIANTKFDLALIVEDNDPEPATHWRKTGQSIIQGRVLDDHRAFDQPARYTLNHPQISEIYCFTHTYTGQAVTGETVEAAGAVETADDGRQRLVVGSSREALGEFLRVID